MANVFDRFDKDAPKPSKSDGGNPFDTFDRTVKRDYALSEVPGAAVSNLGKSGGQFLSNIYEAVTNPVDTAVALGDLAAGGLRAGAKAVLPERVFNAIDALDAPATTERVSGTANAFGNMMAERYGGYENLKRTMAEDPVGFLADASTVLTAGGTAAAQAPGVVGRAGQTVRRVGDALDPLTVAGRGSKEAGRGVGALTSEALGLSTGTSGETVRAAFDAGRTGNRAFVDQMRGRGDVAAPVEMARSALDDMRAERGAAYRSGMAGVNADKTVLDYAGIDKAINDASTVPTYSGIVVSDDAAKVLKDITDKVGEFRALPAADQTPAAFDAMKRAVRKIKEDTKPGTEARKVASTIEGSIRETIVKQAPTYAETMADYARASDQLDELTRTFSLGEKATDDTALRKLQSILRNNVNTSYGQRASLGDVLSQSQPDLLPALAGQQLGTATPRGLARLYALGQGGVGLATMNPLLIPGVIASSPRVVGEATYGAGQVAGAVGRAADRVPDGTTRAAGQSAFQGGRLTEEEEFQRRAREILMRR